VGSIFWKTTDIALYSTYVNVLYAVHDGQKNKYKNTKQKHKMKPKMTETIIFVKISCLPAGFESPPLWCPETEAD
jgi:hypothetical protein